MEHTAVIEDFENVISNGEFVHDFTDRISTTRLKVAKDANSTDIVFERQTSNAFKGWSVVNKSRPFAVPLILFNQGKDATQTVSMATLIPFLVDGAITVSVFSCVHPTTMTLPMFNNPEYSDVTLEVGDKLFHLHKCILCRHSSVFKAMLQAGMSEAATNKIVMEGFSADAVELFLKYMYGGYILYPNVTEDTDRELCRLACMYRVDALKYQASARISCTFTVENCLELLQFAQSYDCEYLKRRVIDGIIAKSTEVFSLHKTKFAEIFGLDEGLELITLIACKKNDRN